MSTTPRAVRYTQNYTLDAVWVVLRPVITFTTVAPILPVYHEVRGRVVAASSNTPNVTPRYDVDAVVVGGPSARLHTCRWPGLVVCYCSNPIITAPGSGPRPRARALTP